MENNISLQNEPSESETTIDEVQEVLDPTSPEKKAPGERQEEMAEKEEGEKKASDEEDEQPTSPSPTSNLHPSTSAEGQTEISKEEANTEAASSSRNPDPLHPPHQRRQPPTRRSHLTKRDKKIIEKIRSYYEAAAEAEEDESEEEEDLREGALPQRRNSFTEIPSGLVKDSVSRFTVGGHQGESESEQTKHEGRESCSPTGPFTSSTSLAPHAESDGEVDKAISSLGFDAEDPTEPPISDEMPDKESPAKADVNLQSNPNRLVEEETEIQEKNGNICKGSMEEGEKGEAGVVVTGEQDGISQEDEDQFVSKSTGEGQTSHPVTKGHEPNQTEPARGQTEPSTSLQSPEQWQKDKETKAQAAWPRTKNRDLANTSGTLEGLPSQIKVGRWSRHSRIVTANRVLFEGMASDVAGIGLFEANPVVDSVLIENSERILSKVQTLAQMYSAKASTKKMPLHQKRASTVRNQSWVTARLSGPSAQSQTQGQTQVNPQRHTQTQSHHQMETSQSDILCGTKTHAETKAESQTKQQSGRAYQIQTMTQMSRGIQEEGTMKSPTDGTLTFMAMTSPFLKFPSTRKNSF